MNNRIRKSRIDPSSRWKVAAGFTLDLPGVPSGFAPSVGSIWPASHAGIAHLIRHRGIGTFIVPADATETEVAAARQAAATVALPETERPLAPDPPAPDACTKRLVTQVPASAERGAPPAFVRGVEVG